MGTSLTISLALILFGAALIWAGWTGRSLKAILSGSPGAPAPKAASS
jgi:hypothetical protein